MREVTWKTKPVMRRRYASALLVLFAAVLFGACGGRQTAESPVIKENDNIAKYDAETGAPKAIILEREIRGQLFGRRLSAPTAIRQTKRGAYYLIDRGNLRLVKLDSALNAVAEFGGSNSSGGRLLAPNRLAQDGRGNIFLSDAELREVLQFDEGLNLVKEILFSDNDDALKFGEPDGVAVDNDGILWVSDNERSRLAIFDRFGEFREFYADFNSGGSHLERPGAMFPLPQGGVILCDAGEGQALIFNSYGVQRGIIGKKILRSPVDVSVDRDGRFWICDSALAEVLCFQPDGELLFRTGDLGAAYNIHLTAPTAICVRDDNTLLISDTGADRILVCRIIVAE